LNPDVVPLEDHLGEARTFLDLAIDQSAAGLEVVPGTVTYTYRGNWKMQLENSADAYHFVPTHQSYLQILRQRENSGRRNFSAGGATRGSFTFAHGHNVHWGAVDKPEGRPLWLNRDEVLKRVGETRLKWMFMNRNLLVFPNLQLLENVSLQIRVNRPLAPDRTEITTYCVAPKGESREARTLRLRQYEEFYNPSGFATPDDLAIFEACQSGQQSNVIDWHLGYMRGQTKVQSGPDRHAEELGIRPLTSVASEDALGDETIFHSQYREWRRLLMKGLTARPERSNAIGASP
jgi:phenylpropionate dioxygenase-like ring-hydroxylating dioxygenase large terminal subunit